MAHLKQYNVSPPEFGSRPTRNLNQDNFDDLPEMEVEKIPEARIQFILLAISLIQAADMLTLPANSSLIPYMGLLMCSNANLAFHRIVQAIIGSRGMQDTIDPQDIVQTTFKDANRFSVSPELVAALQQTTEVFVDILTHAVHNVPFNTVATLLSIPHAPARQLQLTRIDNLEIAYLHY
ncbi:hypothetical protein IW261DRAFT_1573738 [Armillaria novae-zelandiae]|uniref:Uncharacterized protein n=1 Tax=Armillaria novae-zelandiae TaxID=153914 RepID=A0AA39NMR5_9AGAR|nr:hypothetical protein IW261DRAFT_1573738 [Armillaria novae-zelandiae]